VCKIDGRKITTRDLDGGPRSLQFRRLMANRFMFKAANETVFELRNSANQQREKLSPGLGQQMTQEVETAFQLLAMTDPQTRKFAKTFFDRALQTTELVIRSPNAKEDDKAVARAYQAALTLGITLQGSNGQYFVNAPSKTRRDEIEFLLWQKKADQLGIRYGREDVKRLIQHEFADSFSPKADVAVRKELQEMKGFTMEGCLDALADEFRVRAAQTAVLGAGARYHSALALTTPYEAFEFYREQCSPTTYDILAVPDALFLDKVTGEPTTTELNELYAKYQNDEPNPKSETPGFKTPRKIEVGYLGITGEEPYYKKLAEEQIKAGEVMAKASGALTVPLPGMGGAWGALVAGPLSLKEPAVDAAYQDRVREFEFERDVRFARPDMVVRDLLPSSVARPGVAAAVLGAMVGQTAGHGSPVAATLIATAAPIGYEIRDRVKVGLPLVLGGVPGPGLLPAAVGGAAAAVLSEPKPLPVEALRADLLTATIDKRAKVLAFGGKRDASGIQGEKEAEKGDVNRFIEELKKLSDDGKPKDKAPAEKYIKEFIAARGLDPQYCGGSKAPADEWALQDDPGLAQLVSAQKLSLSVGSPHGNEYMPFGRSFFWKTEDARTQRRVPSSGLYLAEAYPPGESEPRFGLPRYVVWRTKDEASAKRDRNVAKDALKDAWKRIKARELARKEADAIAEKIRTSPAAGEADIEGFVRDQYYGLLKDVRDPKVIERLKTFKVDNVAPLTIPSQVGLGQLKPFGLPESNDIPYPTPEMATALLENRDKPVKTVLVLPDAPKDTFYVAVLTKRTLKQPHEFQLDAYSSRGQAREILGLYQAETIKKARDSVLDLLKKEFRYEETDAQKAKLDENAKSGGRGDE
jgi:hypothetical protein